MSDVTCPYCGKEQEINHDDGYGYEEDRDHEQECIHCDKPFRFQTSIDYHYEVYCQDGDHNLEPLGSKYPGMYRCKKCDLYEKR